MKSMKAKPTAPEKDIVAPETPARALDWIAPPADDFAAALRQIDDCLAAERAVREEIPEAIRVKAERLVALAGVELAAREPLAEAHKPFIDTMAAHLQDKEFRRLALAARQDPARLDRLADEADRYLVGQTGQLQRGQKNVQAALGPGEGNRNELLELGRLEIESVTAGDPQVGAGHLVDVVQRLQAALKEIAAYVSLHGAPPAGPTIEIPPPRREPVGGPILEFDRFNWGGN